MMASGFKCGHSELARALDLLVLDRALETSLDRRTGIEGTG